MNGRGILLLACLAGGCGTAMQEADVSRIKAGAPEAPVNRWVLRSGQAPNIVWENGSAWDPEARRVVWHGGHMGRDYPQSNYTFLHDPVANRFTESQSLARPQRRCLVHVAYLDGCRRTITTDGGVNHGSIPEGGVGGAYTNVFHADPRGPWLYDSAKDAWEDCRPLPPVWKRAAHAPVCYEPNSDAVFGLRGTNLWIYSPRLNRVTTRSLPPELHNLLGHGLAADPVRGKLVLFGGVITTKRPEPVNGKNVHDASVKDFTWVYDVAADSWKQCVPKMHPPKGVPKLDMLSLQMVWHDASGTVLLMQNATEENTDNTRWPPAELWSFDPGTEQWALVPMAEDGPRPAFMGLVTYDRTDDLLVVFGGGRDGTGEEGRPDARPGHSRLVWTCRVSVPGTQPVAQPRPERIRVAVSEQAAIIEWPVEPGVKYDVFRAMAAPLPGAYEKITLTALAGGSFEDRAVEPGRIYAYQVAAAGAARRSLPTCNQPARPAGLLASVESAKEVRLSWEVDAVPDLAGYRVYRARGAQIEKAEGELLTPKPVRENRFTDAAVDLSDGVIRAYWVTAVNRAGLESGAAPLAYTVPDAPRGLALPEGVAPADGVGNRLAHTFGWRWPADVKVAGFNVYHATESIDTLLAEGGYQRFWKLWTRVNDQPVKGNEIIFPIQKDGPRNHYFHVRAVNVLGQEGFYSDLVSPTDRQFRP